LTEAVKSYPDAYSDILHYTGSYVHFHSDSEISQLAEKIEEVSKGELIDEEAREAAEKNSIRGGILESVYHIF